MGTNFIWWSAIALEAAILFRSAPSALLKKYPLFYAYIGCVLLIEVLRFCSHTFTPNFYPAFFWHTDPVTIVARYALILEIFGKALKHNPGLARRAQKLQLLGFVIALTSVATDLLHVG